MFEFNWKYKDFEIRSKIPMKGKNPYIELVKWEEGNSGRRTCFTLAYWHIDKDNYPELHFVGDRPFEYLAELDVTPIWKQLFLAQAMLEDVLEKERHEEDYY